MKVVSDIDFYGRNSYTDSSGKTLAVRWTGFYTPPASGPQLFLAKTVRGDGDAYRLYVNDKLVLQENRQRGRAAKRRGRPGGREGGAIRFEYTPGSM